MVSGDQVSKLIIAISLWRLSDSATFSGRYKVATGTGTAVQVEKTMDAEHQALAELYQQGFDPAEYLRYNYSYPRADFSKEDSFTVCLLKTLHKAFTEGDIKGGVLLDVGSGPTIYQVMAACEIFDKVIMSDFLEANRNELRNWLENNGKCSLDWSPFFKYACKLEGREPSAWEEKAARLRKVLKGIVPANVHLPQPVSADVVPPEGADCIVSCFCLDAACLTMPLYSRDLGHVVSLLKPGGHLMIVGTVGMTYYYGGPQANVSTFPFTEVEVCQLLRENGMSLIRLEMFPLPQKEETTDDAKAILFVKAKKD
ncbi:phenylethanolamine N-methyltransferase-like [Synchiropus splendidus]|uniref:phenylethanolamine N-methyltransferase-like n=1 Tax=Synchiropus splendidus TaxID=270530 RepID=UPI00237EADE5|nr:phenylethanolamine N-methyltransferase-like [Synchiropus splendidus]